MSSYFDGVDTSYNFMDSYFGTSSSTNNSGASSLSSALGDLQMINSGVYKKALKSYYANTKTSSSDDRVSSDSESDEKDSDVKLSSLKDASQKLNKAALALQNKDYNKVKTSEDVLEDVKSLVSSYNSALNATKDMNTYSILQTAVWMKDRVGTSEALLNKVGISVNEDNTLSIDEEKFKKADLGALKTLFSGSGSLVSQLAQKGSSLAAQSKNQIAVNSGKTLYTSSGTM